MSMDFSVVLIVPVAKQADANLLACAFGYDELPGHTFERELSATGEAPITHYGAHTWANAQFTSMLEAFNVDGSLPPIPWADFGLTEPRASAVVSALLTRIEPGGPPRHNWSSALTENGLQEMATPAEPEPEPSGLLI